MVKINSIAEHSGLQVGDQLLSINSQDTATISEFSMGFIQALEGEILQLKAISKTSDLKTLTLDLKGDFLANPEQGIEQYLGFEFDMPGLDLEPIINQVINTSAADLSGIQSNDKILQANGKAIDSWRDFVEVIKRNPQQPIQLQVERNHRIIELILTPKNENGTPKAGVTVMMPEGYLDEWRVLVKKGVVDAFLSANVKVYQLTLLNLKMIKKMILGEASLKQLSGPISIANYAGKTAQMGLIPFLSFLAFISISIGLLNLLPIPLLDGGHLFFYLIEILKGSPVSQTSQQVSIKLGLFVILSLTFIALYNDFLRLLS